MENYTFFAVCPFYLEELMKAELESFGAKNIQIAHGGASFDGSIETAYRACLWSRTANRILFPLVSFDAEKPEDIRAAAEGFEWENHFPLSSTLAVDSTLTKTKICTPDYAALSVKDGIVDRARRLTGGRPDVDLHNPDIRLNLHITLKRGAIALDLSGDGLHKRGYRLETVKAGVRENTAAAVLLRAGWDKPLTEPRLFLDPMCGSGTLVTEAALIAADIAPAINRKNFGFNKWKHHDRELWLKLKTEADERRRTGIAAVKQKAEAAGGPLFYARDLTPKGVNSIRTNLRASAAAELLAVGVIDIRAGDFFAEIPPEAHGGLVAVNPPYGERLNRDDDMLLFYRKMGEVFKRDYRGWKIAVLTGHRELAESIGLRADKVNTMYNGGIRCTLAHFRVFADKPAREDGDGDQKGARKSGKNSAAETAGREYPSFEELSPGAQMVYNRLKKNSKRLKKWLKTGVTECYRLYDADMPEYSAAVDIYPPEVVIQEYAAPKTIDTVAASGRLRELMLAVQSYLELPEESVKLKKRRKQRGSSQYEKSSAKQAAAERRIIREHGHRFLIDTSSYLDTGIFLDSRPIRDLLKNEAAGKTFLNLFCYTATASVYAAAGGAVSTTSVDASRTYLEWGEGNMKINGFAEGDHTFIKSDCTEWLKQSRRRWDLIYLDPPTFSNSKDRKLFDLQKDHEELIRLTASKLSSDGLLIFCNNFRKFRMSTELESEFDITEITDQTIDPDFERRKSIHRCWKIRQKERG